MIAPGVFLDGYSALGAGFADLLNGLFGELIVGGLRLHPGLHRCAHFPLVPRSVACGASLSATCFAFEDWRALHIEVLLTGRAGG